MYMYTHKKREVNICKHYKNIDRGRCINKHIRYRQGRTLHDDDDDDDDERGKILKEKKSVKNRTEANASFGVVLGKKWNGLEENEAKQNLLSLLCKMLNPMETQRRAKCLSTMESINAEFKEKCIHPSYESHPLNHTRDYSEKTSVRTSTKTQEDRSEERETEHLIQTEESQDLYGTTMKLVSANPSLRCRNSRSSDETNKINQDLEKFDLNMGNEFGRLLYAIDVVTKQVEIAFEGLHEMVDSIQKNLVENNDSDKKVVRTRPIHHQSQSCLMLSPSTGSLCSLKRSTEMAREGIRMLTSLLFLEKDSEGMDFQNREDRVWLIKPYLGSPVFERFSHTKHGLEHCISLILFKASNIPARTQRVIVSSSASKMSGKDNEDFQFERFCKKGKKALELFAGWEEEKWSEPLKIQFISTSKHVWELQSVIATTMRIHQVEILHPDPDSEFDELTMDAMNDVSNDFFLPLVQFTVFHGFKVDGSILIKPQVYLHVQKEKQFFCSLAFVIEADL